MSRKIQIKNKLSTLLPCIPMRGVVLFPNSVIHFDIGRKKSVAAIEYAMERGIPVFFVSQKDIAVEEPTQADVYDIGVVAEVKQVLRVSNDVIKVLVEGKYRARLNVFEVGGSYCVADVSPYPFQKATADEKSAALVRKTKELFNEYMNLCRNLSREMIMTVMTSSDPAHLAEYLGENLMVDFKDKQRILSISKITRRLEIIVEILMREIKVLSLEQEISEKVHDQMDKNQRDYYLREQMRVISEELGEGDDSYAEAERYKKAIALIELDDDDREKLNREADRLAKMVSNTQEAAVIRTYLDNVLDLPWNKYTEDKIDIAQAAKILNNDHYGLEKIKERILELLSIKSLAPDIKGQIMCFVGPPGVGKTSIARSIARCMNRNFARFSLGGVRDEAEIMGHRRTYVASMPGKIITALQNAKSKNPVILLDEIDKLGNDFRGDPASALLEVLDTEQNQAFKDHYLDIPFDLSEVLFITTANNPDTIPPALYDRMDVIELSSYTSEEKFNIAKKHLVPKQVARHGLTAATFKLSDGALRSLIEDYTREAGVRNLEREIANLCRKAAKRIVENGEQCVRVKEKELEAFLGPKKYKRHSESGKNKIGVANGLAWTAVGGEMLPIEVVAVKGTGKVEITGQLGDVMKESAKIAITYARTVADKYGYSPDFFSQCDLHIHAPEGAVHKDGPSAGVTLTTALISALSGIPVRADVAMTGEITLQGSVLPIGGLKEKSMSAYREGMHIVVIPEENLPDLAEIDDTVKSNLTFIPVSDLKKVLENTLVNGQKVKKNAAE